MRADILMKYIESIAKQSGGIFESRGYDQLGEDEKEVLECGNCFNGVSWSSCLPMPPSMAFFTRLCQICLS